MPRGLRWELRLALERLLLLELLSLHLGLLILCTRLLLRLPWV